MSDVSNSVEDASRGKEAVDKLFKDVYSQLRRLAARTLAGQSPGHTLQPTALVHEAYAKLIKGANVTELKDSQHFLAVVVIAMNQILADHARKRTAKKRGGDAARLASDNLPAELDPYLDDRLDLALAIQRFESVDPQAHQAILLRVYGGLTNPEIAEHLRVSLATVERDLRHARAWLIAILNPDDVRL